LDSISDPRVQPENTSFKMNESLLKNAHVSGYD
jgi:hypothetical protein